MAGGVDLHAHTTASDGALAPRDLVRLAARQRVGVLAVTDHDSTDGLPEAMEEAARHGMEIVPGLEINCDVPGSEIHVLGYWVAGRGESAPTEEADDPAGGWRADWFQAFLREQRAERVARVHRIAERLTELGMPITAEEVFAICREGSPGRPHVAQAMVNRGHVKSVREAFDRWLHAGGPANVPRRRLTPVEAVRVIRKAGGVPVLAHPGLAQRDEMIPELVEAGLAGIETYYPEHSVKQIEGYEATCARLGLVATGGSDYHGSHTGRAATLGGAHVPPEVWPALQRKASELTEQAEQREQGRGPDHRTPEPKPHAERTGGSEPPPSRPGHPRA